MFYSKSRSGFYSHDIHGENIPEDSVEITDEEYSALMQGQMEGMIITANEDGFPSLISPPPPTPEELLQQATTKKSILISEASAAIAPLADAKAGGYIDDEDIPRLDEWQRYRYQLTKVDTSTPQWPEKPE